MNKGRGFSVKKWWSFGKWLKIPDTEWEINRTMVHFSSKQVATPLRCQLHQISSHFKH